MEELVYLVIGSLAGAVVAPKIRPALLAMATAGYKLADAVTSKTAEQRKSAEGFFAGQRKTWEEFFAEAKARARAARSLPQAQAKA